MKLIYVERLNKAINLDQIITIEVAKEHELYGGDYFEVRAYFKPTRDTIQKTYAYEVLAGHFDYPEEAEDYIKAFVKKYE